MSAPAGRVYADTAAETTCAACRSVGRFDERTEVIPRWWRMDVDGLVYCERCIRAYVRPDLEARG